MDVTLSGISRFMRLIQPRNALCPILVILSGMVICIRESHPANVKPSKDLILALISTVSRLTHPWNAAPLILSTPLGICAVFNATQSSNALYPMLLTVLSLILVGTFADVTVASQSSISPVSELKRTFPPSIPSASTHSTAFSLGTTAETGTSDNASTTARVIAQIRFFMSLAVLS